tara:strand:+ start:935 stop:2101 length:1167 start_codon:yes stop_codon:yes gene_type:complete
MSYLVIGSGWHPALFRAEIKELSTPFEVEQVCESSRVMSIDLDEFDLESELFSQLSRSATIDELLFPSGWIRVSDLPYEGNIQENLIKYVSEWIISKLDQISKDSIAVRWERIDGGIDSVESSVLAGYLGSTFVEHGWTVDLDNPSTELMLILDGSCEMVCWGIRKISCAPRIGWKERVATERPFFKPISLDPILAKVMVNLTGITSSDDGYLCDPMCGTGGILMEAALMDLPYVGIDLDREMIDGSKLNLEWILKKENMNKEIGLLQHGNATKLTNVFRKLPNLNISAFAFDPPYGRNSWQSEKEGGLLSSVLNSCNEVVSSKSDVKLMCVLPWDSLKNQKEGEDISDNNWLQIKEMFEKSNWRIIDKFSIHVHSSMSRLLIRATNL